MGEQAVELNEILEQLYIFTNIFQGDGVTISRLIPSLNTVISRIDLRKRHEEAKASNSSIPDRIFYYEDFCSRLVAGLKSRFEYAYKDQIFTISCILDPNYGMTWIPLEDRPYWIEKIKLMINEIDESETLGSMTARLTANRISPLNTKTINLDAHEETFEEDYEYETMIKNFLSTQKQARIEAKKTSEMKGDKDAYVDPLMFWKFNEKNLLQLSRAARSLLGIPATSAYIERVFSKTGYILRPHRRTLADQIAEDLFYSKENLRFV